MAQRDIILVDVTKPGDLQRLCNYIRELFGLLSPRIQTTSYSATPTFDASLAETFFMILTGNVTGITIKNADTGRRAKFIFLQDSTGGRTVAGWPASVLLAGGSFTPTATANKYSTVTLEYVNSKWIETGRTLNVG